MKPILTWFEDLPEPYRSQAIENYNSEYLGKSACDNLHQALYWGFNWSGTEQGGWYWCDIRDRALSGEFDKK